MTKFQLTIKAKKENYCKYFYLDNFENVIELYNIKNPFNHSKELICELISYVMKINKKSYISWIDIIEDLSLERLEKYISYKEQNKSDSSSEKFYKLKYGKHYLIFLDKRNENRPSPYDVNYIMKREGLTLEEAENYIKEYKKNKATNLEGFIKRHGEELGSQLFEKFKKTSTISKENLIRKYGNVIGEEKYNQYILNCKTSSKRSIEYWLNKGLSLEDAKNEQLNYQKDNSGCHFEHHLKKSNGDIELAKKTYEEMNKKKDSSSFEHHLKKANGDIELAKKTYEESCKLKDSMSIKSFMRRGLSYEESIIRRQERLEQMICKNGVSKESLKLFDDVISTLNLNKENVMYNEQELSLYCLKYDRIFKYDFTFRNKIVEYNGVAFHPKAQSMSEGELKKWKSPFKDVWGEEQLKFDTIKNNFAEDKGYELLVIWSDDIYEDNKNKIISFLME